MKAFLNRNLTAIAILASVLVGFSFPDIGIQWRPYVNYLLMLLMFSTVLTIDPKEVLKCARDTKFLATAVFMIFVFAPLLALTSRPFVLPMTFAGIMLALSAPSAVATAFFAGAFKGDKAYGLVISIATNLLAILTIPTTMFLAVGSFINIDLPEMFLNLALLILVPVAIGFIAQRALHSRLNGASGYTSRVNLVIIFFIIWASIAPATAYAEQNLQGFLWLIIFILALLAILFAISYKLVAAQGRSKAITAGIATGVKNGALPLVIATTLFNAEILLPLVANLVAQSLLLVFLGAIIKEK